MKWVKQNGQEIETNDEPATIKGAEALGWKRPEKPKAMPAAKAKPKAK